MQIIPAIDLRGGKCVRLRQGDYNQETVFSDDPAEMAMRWVDLGGDFLHLVDLDGARDGSLANLDAIERIVSAVHVPCELGGGIRSEDAIRRMLDLGLRRLVVGTLAIRQPQWFKEMCAKFPRKLVLGIDARDGFVATDGWLETSQTSAISLAQQFDDVPLDAIIYTDIATDGMMSGANVPAMREMKDAVRVPVVASGGVSSIEDVRRLSEAGLDACIIGRALYEGAIDLRDVCGKF
ncbi:MAG: 1-(5-phosphoribosyl)-5-[(5-phosphoribosylamino)methylideneamino]imidazole-4-carboxamide isomerase [Planctomycetia bacterium]|nr:1-(5-phosphoribosyl)-5-[(5-phosphoribosylamino)methylideneamino]imidazole-4-carboxamide isomerase [Planctomycetia bacterium]